MQSFKADLALFFKTIKHNPMLELIKWELFVIYEQNLTYSAKKL